MKYMLMIYGNEELWGSFPPEEFEKVVTETDALQAELKASGEFVGAYGVGDQVLAKQVTLVDGTPTVTDGPYIEAKEYLGSFDIIDVDSLERGARDRRPGAVRPPRAGRGATADARGTGRTRDQRSGDRGPAARARAAGPRRAGAPLRPLRRRRGRGAGSAAGRRGAVARPRAARQPGRVAHHGRVPAADRPAPQRRRPTTARGHRCRGGAHVRERRRVDVVTAVDDDTLTLLFLCCHPALSSSSQLALTLRAVGGLTTAEIAHGVPGARSRRWRSGSAGPSRRSGPPARPSGSRPPTSEPIGLAWCCTCSTSCSTRATRRRRVTTSSAPTSPPRRSASTRALHALLPDDGEVAGLLALMLLTDARRSGAPAPTARWYRSTSRTGPAGTAPSSPRASHWSPTR